MVGLMIGLVAGLGMVVAASAFVEFPATGEIAAQVQRWPYLWIGASTAITVGRVTGWWFWAVTLGGLVALVPRFQRDVVGEKEFADITDAVASWTESLRDTMGGSHGVQGALLAVAPSAPPAIRQHSLVMAEDITAGVPLATALDGFARRVANPVSDLVCAVLGHAVRHSAAEVPEMLESIAATARERARAHGQIEVSRSKPKRTVQLAAVLIVVLGVVIVTLMRDLIDPLISDAGQIPVTVATLMILGALVWMSELAKVRQPLRLLRTSQLSQVGLNNEGVAP